jgi:Domain of unknown function (DUF4398)
MPASRRTVLFVVCFTVLTCLACGDPPTKELQQAQRAIEAARASGADRYAREEFAAAEASLESANAAVEQRDYRLALNRALDAEARAQSAASDADARKGAARSEADKTLKVAAAALAAAHARLQAAEAARARPRIVAPARRAIAAGDRSLQEARTAFGAGDYLKARDTAQSATTHLAEAVRDLESATPAPVRRRR